MKHRTVTAIVTARDPTRVVESMAPHGPEAVPLLVGDCFVGVRLYNKKLRLVYLLAMTHGTVTARDPTRVVESMAPYGPEAVSLLVGDCFVGVGLDAITEVLLTSSQ